MTPVVTVDGNINEAEVDYLILYQKLDNPQLSTCDLEKMIKSFPGTCKILHMTDDLIKLYITCIVLIIFGHTEKTKDGKYFALL